MKRFQSVFTLLALTLSTSAMAESSDLLSLYQRAVDYDATIAAAKANLSAEEESEALAMANLLPSLTASAVAGHSDDNTDSALSADDSYQTTRYTVTLTQSVFSMPSWYGLNAAELRSLQAQTVYLSEQQDLMLNVASAYFKVLREQENLTTSKAEVAAFKRQYEQAREQFDVGLIAITDVHEAKATYDSAQTARIRSEGNLTLAVEDLSRLTGQYAPDLNTLKADFAITADANQSADKWAQAALENNLDIKAAEYALKALEEDLKGSKAGHLPSLNLRADYEHNDFSGRNPDLETLNKSIFLSLDLPLYSGGATSASIRQTRSRVEQARHQLIGAERLAKIEARSEFINLQTSVQTVDSLQQNIISRESALEATREGYNVGTRNIVEVLDAERNYFSALRDYANARFDYVESSLRLKRAVGVLNESDLQALNAWLAPKS